MVIYTGALWVASVLFNSLWHYASHGRHLVDAHLPDALVRAVTARYLVGPIGYGLAFGGAFWFPLDALLLATLVTICFLVPSELFSRAIPWQHEEGHPAERSSSPT